MFQTLKSKIKAYRSQKSGKVAFAANTAVTATLFAMLLTVMPIDAMAQTFDIPFLSQFGCGVVKYMKGPLAILIFVLVSIATLVVGMIAKMDWSRIIQVCVVFGIVISIGSVLANSSYVQSAPAIAACLM